MLASKHEYKGVMAILAALLCAVILIAPASAWAADAGQDGETAPVSAEDLGKIEAAFGSSSSEVETQDSGSAKFVVALDAGHGGNDTGALGNGLQEKDINLRLALACAQRLRDRGVDVVLIRDSDNYVYSTNASLELQARCTKARNAGASVYVSLHCNSAGASANGAEVWYPQDVPYNNQCYVQGRGLASVILDRLTNGEPFGIARRGIYTRDYGNGVTYADGTSDADYYAVIRHSREYGIPAIIVEHGFITNASDAANLNAHAEAMGSAEADAIYDYFNLDYRFEQDGTGRTRITRAGSAMTNQWVQQGGKWYWADADGYMATGWRQINGAWYWMDSDGAAATGWRQINGTWYWFDYGSCAMATGWRQINGAWYWLQPSGAMAVGPFEVDGVKYVASDSGACPENAWLMYAGTWYHTNGSAAIQLGWQWIGDTWYWLDPQTGAMAVGPFTAGGVHYVASDSGSCPGNSWVLYQGSWYRTNASSAVLYGWQWINGTWYWLTEPDGRMIVGPFTVNGVHYVASDSGSCPGDSWVWSQGSWYRTNASSAVLYGWQYVNGSWYWLTQPDGKMATGWIWDGNAYYYLAGSGAWDGRRQFPQTIMGSSSVSADAMAQAYARAVGAGTYPASAYAGQGAPTIRDFCQIILDEAQAEGVRAEVVFAQSMLETNWLRFGGQVSVGQCNFAGIGAVDGGAAGADFSGTDLDGDGAADGVRAGIRAQVQHLKAYASTDGLVRATVDPRFGLVRRGSITYVQGLGIPDDPAGIGWASAAGYGMNIVSLEENYLGLSL